MVETGDDQASFWGNPSPVKELQLLKVFDVRFFLCKQNIKKHLGSQWRLGWEYFKRKSANGNEKNIDLKEFGQVCYIQLKQGM